MSWLPLLAQLPKQGGDFQTSPTPFIILALAGAVIATFGHMAKSKNTVGVGIGMIFMATVFIPLGFAFFAD